MTCIPIIAEASTNLDPTTVGAIIAAVIAPILAWKQGQARGEKKITEQYAAEVRIKDQPVLTQHATEYATKAELQELKLEVKQLKQENRDDFGLIFAQLKQIYGDQQLIKGRLGINIKNDL